MIILSLNENPIQKPFSKGAISGKELRLRANIDSVDHVFAISRPGKAVGLPKKKTLLEKKITINHTIYWPYNLGGIILFFYGFFSCLRNKPTIIEAESPIISGPAAIILGKIFSIPTIIEIRASYQELLKHRLSWVPMKVKRFLLNRVCRFSYHHASVLIANSNMYQRQLAKDGYKSVVINPGIQNPPKQNKRLKPSEPFIIGYLGRLVEEKGVAILIDALHLLSQETKVPPWIAQIAGEGPQKDFLCQMVKAYKLQKKIVFLGMVDNFQTLNKWYVLVNPNLVSHPLEMVNAEAAFMGVPVITFGNRHLPETVINNSTGLISNNQTPESIAKNLKQILTSNNLWSKLHQNGPSFARDNYSFQKQSAKLKKVYEKIT